MENDLVKSNLIALERKINMLIGDRERLKDEVAFLRDENQSLKSLVKSKDDQLKDFQNKIKITKIVSNLNMEEGKSSELREKIDNYIKEIDRCIAHLSK